MVQVCAQDVAVGHILQIQTNQRVPADVVLLRTPDPNGVVYLRTDQLDGETEWKLRLAVQACQKTCGTDAALDALHGADDTRTGIDGFLQRILGDAYEQLAATPHGDELMEAKYEFAADVAAAVTHTRRTALRHTASTIAAVAAPAGAKELYYTKEEFCRISDEQSKNGIEFG